MPEEAAAPSPDKTPPKKIPLMVPGIIAGAFFMDGLDSSILTTSLPQMAESLHVLPAEMGVAITAYLLAIAVFIPISGWVADRFGPRQVFCAAIALFTLGSILCGFSTSLEMLVGSRVIQGMGGALMTPVGRLILQRVFPKEQLMRAMSYNMMPALIGPTIGPVVGGFITTTFSWHWNFFVNVPFGIAGIYLAMRYIDDIPMVKPKRFDWRGYVIIAVAMVLTQLAIENIGQHDSSVSRQLVMAGAAILALGTYILYASRQDAPVLDLKLFKKRVFAIAILGGGFIRILINATLFLIPLLLQVGFGLSPVDAGVLTLLFTGGSLMMRTGTQHVVRYFGMKTTLIFSTAVAAFMMAGFSLFTAATPHLVIGTYLVCFGVLRSLQLLSTSTLTVADLRDDEMSRGNAIASVSQRFFQSLGTGIAASMLSAMAAGEPMTASDFKPAFYVFAAISACAALLFMRMKPEDGWQVSGHRAGKK
jgi:EmrB/QacA subfamily drug resistance transporter